MVIEKARLAIGIFEVLLRTYELVKEVYTEALREKEILVCVKDPYDPNRLVCQIKHIETTDHVEELLRMGEI